MTQLRWLVGGLLAGWLLLWRRVGDRWGWLGMLNAWAEWGLLMLTALGGSALLRREGAQAAALLGVAAGVAHRLPSNPLLAAFALRTGRMREAVPALPSALPITLLTANLYKLNGDAAPHIALIRRHHPDILCFQELTPPLAAQLLDALGDAYPHRAWRPAPGAYGFGVLSRFPVEETGHWTEPGVRPWCQRVRVALPNAQPLEIYNVHLVAPTADSTLEQGMTWGFRVREEQVRLIHAEMAARGVPACLIGDCNFTDGSDAYRIALTQLGDVWQGAGQGSRWTWPTRGFPLDALPWGIPLLRLDYCFHTAALRPVAAQVLRERTGADHCPLLVTLAVPECYV